MRLTGAVPAHREHVSHGGPLLRDDSSGQTGALMCAELTRHVRDPCLFGPIAFSTTFCKGPKYKYDADSGYLQGVVGIYCNAWGQVLLLWAWQRGKVQTPKMQQSFEAEYCRSLNNYQPYMCICV